jgi:hypothetical protein
VKRRLALIPLVFVPMAFADARPSVSFTPTTRAPGDAITVRYSGVKGPVHAKLRSTEGTRTALRFVGRAAKRSFRATVPNLPSGSYAVQLVRRGRVIATARRGLRVTEAPVGVRDCDSSVYGEFAPGWERRTVWAGPLGLVGATAGNAPKPIRGRPSYFEPIKFVLVLENERVATVRVPPSERAHVALLYATRGGLGEYESTRVVDGLAAVRFEACGRSEVPHTQFNGGLVVAGPRCAELEVHVQGRAEPYPLRVPFGRPC